MCSFSKVAAIEVDVEHSGVGHDVEVIAFVAKVGE
jgi:hypothetical protein